MEDIRLWKTEIELEDLGKLTERVKTNLINGTTDDGKMEVDKQYSASRDDDDAPNPLDRNMANGNESQSEQDIELNSGIEMDGD